MADIAMPPEKRRAFDRMEKLRDPSHTSHLTPAEFLQMAAELKLRDVKTQFVKSERNLETHLQASFP